MTAERWERIGAMCGIAFVVLFVASFALPVTPALEDPLEESIASIRDDDTGLLVNFYIGGIVTILFIGLLAAVWSRERRIAGGDVPSGALLLAGGCFTGIILVVNASFLALVAAVDNGASPQAVEALIVLDNTLFIGAAFAYATLFAALAAVALAGALPRWLGWLAGAVALITAVGLLGFIGDPIDGGGVGVLVFIGFPLGLIWVLATSIVMLRGGERAQRAAEAVGTTP